MPVVDEARGAELRSETDAMASNNDNDDDSPADREWELSRNSLKKALTDNQSLQAKILSELEIIARKKRDNRLEAEKCIAESCAIRPPTTPSNQPDNPTEDNPPNGKRKRPKREKGDPQYMPSNKEINELVALDKDNIDPDKVWSVHTRKKFRLDPFRKWTAEYFTDPTGSVPRDNEDSVWRRQLMMKQRNPTPSASSSQENAEELVPDSFFYHTAQPFTPKEKTFMDKHLFQDGNNHSNYINNRDNASNAFYEDVAQKLKEGHHEDALERWKDKAIFATCLPRSAEDIRMYHKDCLVSKYEFTKEESLAILEGVEEAKTKLAAPKPPASSDSDSEESTTNASKEESDGPDWHNICDKVLDVHKRKQNITGDDFIPITPYRCMMHYKRKLRAQPGGTFTPQEDELMLRYMAAMGPQFVWDYQQITDIGSRLFPFKPAKRLYERTLFSQWHPLVKDKPWTIDEQMKLVLAMKIYNSNPPNNEAAASTQKQEKARLALEKAALRKTSAHFHPYRQSYKVGKKWDRTFSPRFNYKPFTPADEAKLLAAVRSSSVETPFSEIAKKHFPDRSSDQLYQRWIAIAPDQEVLKKYVPTLMRSGLKRGLLSTKGAAEETTAEASSAPNDNKAIFDPSDFVVEMLGNETKSSQN